MLSKHFYINMLKSVPIKWIPKRPTPNVLPLGLSLEIKYN